MIVRILGFVLCMPFWCAAQSEKVVDSKITDVTVFLNRAQVTRVMKMPVERGKTSIVLRGLTAQLDPQSIQVAGKGGFVILGVSHRQNFLDEFNLPGALKVLKDSLAMFERQLLLQRHQKEILEKEEQLLLSNQKIGGTSQNLSAAELKAMADFFRLRLTEIVTARVKADEQIDGMSVHVVKLQQQLNARNELFNRNTSEIVVSILAEVPTVADLAVSYVVANAGWYPVYDLRAINTKSPIQLSYKANVFQRTGEDWKNVQLKLSTANPALGGLKPELDAWYLSFVEPKYEEYDAFKGRGDVNLDLVGKVAGVEVSQKDKERMDTAATISNFVKTVQTSLNTEFNIALPYTVSSSAKPTLVDVRNFEMKADYLYSVAPKLDVDVFLLARATGWEEFSLLPGEANVFFEGTFVGKSYIDPNTIKDTLTVSLGRDKRIVVKRDKLKDFSSRKFIGANRRDSYTYELSVRSTKSEVVQLVVEDQIPVSQQREIEVTPGDLGGAKWLKDSGKLQWTFTLQANETKKTAYSFAVKYPKDKQISGL